MMVYVGKIGAAEVDFVAQGYDGNIEYYQVSWTVRDEKRWSVSWRRWIP